jgi:hypothetical protein
MLLPPVAVFDRIGDEIDELGSVAKAPGNGSSCVVSESDFGDFFDLRLWRRKRNTQPIMRRRTTVPPTAPPTMAPTFGCDDLVFPSLFPVAGVETSGRFDRRHSVPPASSYFSHRFIKPHAYGSLTSRGDI